MPNTCVARLRSPVDYPNGLALLADGALVLGLWLGTAALDRGARRVAGALLVYVAGLALVLTASRAGALGAILAVGLWLALSPKRDDRQRRGHQGQQGQGASQ